MSNTTEFIRPTWRPATIIEQSLTKIHNENPIWPEYLARFAGDVTPEGYVASPHAMTNITKFVWVNWFTPQGDLKPTTVPHANLLPTPDSIYGNYIRNYVLPELGAVHAQAYAALACLTETNNFYDVPKAVYDIIFDACGCRMHEGLAHRYIGNGRQYIFVLEHNTLTFVLTITYNHFMTVGVMIQVYETYKIKAFMNELPTKFSDIARLVTTQEKTDLASLGVIDSPIGLFAPRNPWSEYALAFCSERNGINDFDIACLVCGEKPYFLITQGITCKYGVLINGKNIPELQDNLSAIKQIMIDTGVEHGCNSGYIGAWGGIANNPETGTTVRFQVTQHITKND